MNWSNSWEVDNDRCGGGRPGPTITDGLIDGSGIIHHTISYIPDQFISREPKIIHPIMKIGQRAMSVGADHTDGRCRTPCGLLDWHCKVHIHVGQPIQKSRLGILLLPWLWGVINARKADAGPCECRAESTASTTSKTWAVAPACCGKMHFSFPFRIHRGLLVCTSLENSTHCAREWKTKAF